MSKELMLYEAMKEISLSHWACVRSKQYAQKIIKEYHEAVEQPEIDMITVCDKCLRACCWQGEFMCDDARDAGTVEKPIEELKKLNLEHSEYWDQRA